jgi:hypothetical protein
VRGHQAVRNKVLTSRLVLYLFWTQILIFTVISKLMLVDWFPPSLPLVTPNMRKMKRKAVSLADSVFTAIAAAALSLSRC